MKELELYIHIPFCVKKCNYCDFLSAPSDEKSQSAYIEGLKREIAFYGQGLYGTKVTTIFIGGGTPSWLQESYIEAILQEVCKYFSIDADAEITIECNPGTLTRAKLECYRKNGINRLSIGLQSANNEELKVLGRIHTFEQFLRNYELARECGFDNINVDLMHGLPRQTLDGAYQTLNKVILLSPEHISSYSLIVEKGTPFYDTYKYDMVRQEAGMPTEILPSEDTVYRIGKMTQDILAEHGYKRYEISNYAKEGYACRHNIGYWQRKDYLGLGLGAASLMDDVRYSNLRDLNTYIEKSKNIKTGTFVEEGISTELGCINLHEDVVEIKKDARMEEFMFLGLRMIEGIEKSKFYRCFGFTLDNVYGSVLPKLKEEGLILDTAERLFLTDKGLDLSNYVLAQFLLS